ncbi:MULTISPECIES: (2Fe-2S)-binding protein [Streptomyces]|uniref:(2Fe-2S)-binding protein n=1 Tax=Streptomyces TaxID=1883 RepID=UPI0033A942DA
MDLDDDRPSAPAASALDPGLAALRFLGGFFVLRTGAPPGAPLPTLAEAYAVPPAGSRDALADRVRRVADALAAPEVRVAASVAQQALAARLWSVALGCAVRYGRLPDLDPRLLRWDPAGSAPGDLWLTVVRPGADGNAAAVAEAVLHGHLEPLNAAVRARYRPASGLLWGNAASALVGAARQLVGRASEQGRPDTAERVRVLAAEILAHPLLAGTGTFAAPGSLTGFRRRSCCLYYRIPAGGYCGDCCLPRPARTPAP